VLGQRRRETVARLTNSAKSTRAIIHGNPVVTAIATSPFS
jgi:hypothetical protein